jgi:hypothetical protein
MIFALILILKSNHQIKLPTIKITPNNNKGQILQNQAEPRKSFSSDCHAPLAWKHDIRSYTDSESASHPDNLPETCGQSDCHGYTKKPGNEGFTLTDMHSLTYVQLFLYVQP